MNFKKIILTLLFVSLTGCSISSDNNTPQVIKIEWHLKNVSGGVEGVNDSYDFNVIVWTFNENLNSLKVDNNNTDNSKEDGIDSGSYTYSILKENNTSYLTINESEFGSIVLSNNLMTINQNEKSTGNGADGFIYTFQKVEILEQ